MQNADSQSLTTHPARSSNNKLLKAKENKNDEFYTQFVIFNKR